MLVYRYHCVERPPMPNKLPSGYTDYRVWGSRPYIQQAGAVVLGTVDYPFQLSEKVMNTYGLRAANMQQQPILI